MTCATWDSSELDKLELPETYHSHEVGGHRGPQLLTQPCFRVPGGRDRAALGRQVGEYAGRGPCFPLQGL